MDALTDLLHAVEVLLESWTFPEQMSPSDPVCYVHPDALVALEEAYDQFMDGADLDDETLESAAEVS
jgi:hypothetical protein